MGLIRAGWHHINLFMLFASITQCNEIMCNPANELPLQKNWGSVRYSEEKPCDGGGRERERELWWREKEKEFLTWAFVIDIFCVTLCVLGVPRWFKRPCYVMGRICKGLQATRRLASRLTSRQPPTSFVHLWPFLFKFLNQLSIPGLLFLFSLPPWSPCHIHIYFLSFVFTSLHPLHLKTFLSLFYLKSMWCSVDTRDLWRLFMPDKS